ncbi:DUF4132 domain-containing protein [Roseibacillus ishigakijimensis]|uniref:DUF4132 domain-containing protein n=1 Tax=Roseibacillus ishigakijimensis TaxID=454146 RepID=A0A934RMH3_9BACT|nr:DUF4132 domain-containing protein [Roseibacillus ishigakijimensis]MBK1833515.1 DUF4132 domain-containing protein [Roseibacillus ishigakijimensis]
MNEKSFTELSQKKPAEICLLFDQALDENFSFQLLHDSMMETIYRSLIQHWDDDGRAITEKLFSTPLLITRNWSSYVRTVQGSLFERLLQELANLTKDEANEYFTRLESLIGSANLKKEPERVHQQDILTALVEHRPEFFEEVFWLLLSDKSKVKRDLAIKGLSKTSPEALLAKSAEFLSSPKADIRISAANLLQAIGLSAAIPALTTALENEKSEKVISAIHAALAACGTEVETTLPELTMDDILKSATQLELPKTTWLDLSTLPELFTRDGDPLPEAGLTFLIAKQAKHKIIEASPEIQPLLPHLDPDKSGPFALALFQQWLASEQAAKDRWALTLCGLLGDQRILPELLNPIPDWALNSRHKLAEWAAQAIALVPGDEALTLLDSLATRYRTKFKNIGKACRAALESAAQARGVSLDELADLIVPDHGFDNEYQRPLPDTEILAVLQPNFKLTFLNPTTEKETKSPPATLPETAKEDLKALRKLIRETVKGQSARLELSLVRQRQWPLARWQELFEVHPILQSYASSLVWAHLDQSGKLSRTFRRYPNGLLANAAGELIELENQSGSITLLHPLSLPAEELLAWQQHLDRMKVKPPFPQLERPVATLDRSHKNRKVLKTADKAKLSCGTFRSRAEKRGWARGSVVDAGGISAYYKSYPGAGVDVFLLMNFMYVGQDPMEEVEIGCAYFVKAETVTTGSYIYDEPSSTNDPRVLSFGQVPSIVYSETVTDLQAIVGASS